MLKKTNKHFLIIMSFFLIDTVKCDVKADVKNSVKKLVERHRRLYGDISRNSVKQWELDAEDPTSYPNGNSIKLAANSHAWIDYYRCTSRLVASVTSSGGLPSVHIVVYEGEVARLVCGLCVAPGEKDRVAWFYSQWTHNVSFAPLSDRSSLISKVDVTIFNVRAKDSGLYRCRLGDSVSGILVLEVLSDDNYQVVDAGTYDSTDAAIKPTSRSGLVSFISWTPWSECDVCDRRGKRRRYGMCYVKLNNSKLSVTRKFSNTIFQEFPNGIACGSRLLPATLRNDPTIADRKNVIVTEFCESPCDQVFIVWSRSGQVLERANNSAGLFCLSQTPPPQPPPPAREVVFVKYGERLTLMCPGTTLRDIPITWRRGTEHLSEGTLGGETGHRVHLNARGQIIFASVEDGDANIYSCWQSTALAGVFKLSVWRDTRLAAGRPLTLACVATLALTLLYAVRLLRSKIQYAR